MFAMLRTKLVVSLSLAALVGCATNGGDDDDGGGMIGGEDPGGSRPPITEKGVSTLAGWNNAGYTDGNRQVNLFSNPVNCAFGPDGKVYIADFDNSKLRAVDMNGNSATIIAKREFSRPFGLAFYGNTLYVSTDRDCMGQHDPVESNTQQKGAIWKVDVNAKTATCLMDNLGRPRGMAALGDGRLVIADYAHHDVRIFDPNTRTVSPLAGTRDASGAVDGVGPAATFNIPYGVATTAAGKILVADHGNHRIRVLGLDGSVTTLGGSTAGFADGGMSGAKFNHPQGFSRTDSGDIFVTDLDNYRVRKITADGSSITTIAGNGMPGAVDNAEPGQASFFGLEGLCVSPSGDKIVVADGNRGEGQPYNRVRIIKL